MSDIYLTEDQIEVIRLLSGRGPNAEGNYSDIYSVIANMLPDSQVKLWLEGAASANGGARFIFRIQRERGQIYFCGDRE